MSNPDPTPGPEPRTGRGSEASPATAAGTSHPAAFANPGRLPRARIGYEPPPQDAVSLRSGAAASPRPAPVRRATDVDVLLGAHECEPRPLGSAAA